MDRRARELERRVLAGEGGLEEAWLRERARSLSDDQARDLYARLVEQARSDGRVVEEERRRLEVWQARLRLGPEQAAAIEEAVRTRTIRTRDQPPGDAVLTLRALVELAGADGVIVTSEETILRRFVALSGLTAADLQRAIAASGVPTERQVQAQAEAEARTRPSAERLPIRWGEASITRETLPVDLELLDAQQDVVRLDVSWVAPSVLAGLRGKTWIEHVTLRGVGDEDLSAVASLPGLTTLRIEGRELRDEALRPFRAAEALRRVTLQDARKLGGACLASLPASLVELDLGGCYGLRPELLGALGGLPGLRALRLGTGSHWLEDGDPHRSADAVVAALPPLPALAELSLRGRTLSAAAIRVIPERFPGLTTLDVSGCSEPELAGAVRAVEAELGARGCAVERSRFPGDARAGVSLARGLREILDAFVGGDLRAILLELQGREKLYHAITPLERELLERSGDPRARAVAARIAERAEGLAYGNTCPRCDRPTYRSVNMRVLHGNPFSPAADTEVEHDYRCDSCGMSGR